METLYGLARLFLKRDWQATHRASDAGQGITLLFPMNVLFEAYVAALMRKAIRPLNLSVESQGGRLFCLVEEGGHRRFQTKPDLIIRRRPEDGGKVLAIIDTKWKRLSPMVEDRKNGVSQSDVYQMMAYGQLYGCRELVLLYPHHAGLGEDGLKLPYRVSSSEDRLHLRSVDVRLPEAFILDQLASMSTLWAASNR